MPFGVVFLVVAQVDDKGGGVDQGRICKAGTDRIDVALERPEHGPCTGITGDLDKS